MSLLGWLPVRILWTRVQNSARTHSAPAVSAPAQVTLLWRKDHVTTDTCPHVSPTLSAEDKNSVMKQERRRLEDMSEGGDEVRTEPGEKSM